ncbi:MAG: glycine--tRNA ligase subunit beta [Pseudomonadota bacterium]
MPDLLIELFSEEIPARMQPRAADDLKRLMTNDLVEAGLTYEGAVAHATPRRLTLSVHGLTERSPTTTEERRGPRADAPEKALEGFLRSTGLTRDQLTLKDDKKGQVYIATITTEGRPAAEIVAEVLTQTVRTFPWPKSMRWGNGNLRWVRPLRRILCLLTREDGADIVPLDVDGIASGDVTEGHRFMAPTPFSVTSFDDYETKLKRANVILSAEERAETIWQDATNRAFAAGLEVVEDKGLLAEIAGLVEWPLVLMGAIDDAYLDLPPEVLQTSMKEHQKFLSVRANDGRITHFITVANRETEDDGATILAGNSRVLSARLADAKFFWENDLRIAKAGMAPWLDKLANVTFHAKLGSQADRIDRIATLAREIAPTVGADPDQAERAARLAKADLASEMVYELPELQGVMGRYYALEAGEPGAVANAARDHYAPLGPSDDVPTEPVSVAVALADKIDTLTGFWAIDEKPTGSKDPYALRRAALGVIRIILENGLNLPFTGEDRPLDSSIWNQNNAGYGKWYSAEPNATNLSSEELDDKHIQPALSDLLAFLHDRLKVHLKDEGIRHDVIDACLAAPKSDNLWLLVQRARAVNATLKTEDGENLVQGYRRAANILAQAEAKDGVEYSYGADPNLAETPEEHALFAALAETKPCIDAALETEDFPGAMAALAALRGPIDGFFEAVQVNTDHQVVRRNRLNMLYEIRSTADRIADLSRLDG